MFNIERLNNETYLQYIERVTHLCSTKVIDYNEWGNCVLGSNNCYSSENLRKAFYVIDKILNILHEESDSNIANYEDLKFELAKERKKLQTINLEYHNNARSEGRFELFLENIEEAVKNLKPIEIKQNNYVLEKVNSTGVLFISDAHYGRDVQIKGLYNEIVNEYNIEEFKNRMWNLLNQLEDDFYDVPVDSLDIIDCGDNIEGVLRVGDSLKNLKAGVVDSTMQYAEFMSVWLIECYNRLQIPINYSLVAGNHDVLRLLESKPLFEDETVGKFVINHISLRVENSILKAKLDNQKDLIVTINPIQNVVFKTYYGMNILAYHGESKNMKEDIEYFENLYQVNIDILVGGHLHRSSQESIGYGYIGEREVVRVPSLCGIDNYSHKLRKIARAGSKYMTFNSNGKNWEKTYILN